MVLKQKQALSKYYSGLSSEEDERPEPNDQLARELDNLDIVSPVDLGWEPVLGIVARTLVFVTQDMGIPHRLLAQSLAEYKRKRGRDGDIFWASWRFLPFVLEQSLRKESSSGNIAVLEDMRRLLLRKGLTMFRGVEPVNKHITVPEFYRVSPRRYLWLDMPESMGLDYAFEVIENDSRQGESNQGSV